MTRVAYEPYLKFSQQSGAFLGAFHQPLNEKLQSFFESEDAAQGADGVFAQVAAAVHPNESSKQAMLDRSPYGNPAQFDEDLQGAADRGWITLSETGFTATDKALGFTEKLITELKSRADEAEAAVQADIPRLVALLEHLVHGAEAAPFNFKPTFTYGRNYEYEDKTPSMLWVRRHLISLGSYRDDCHISAWRELEVPGYVFETLTFLWNEEAKSAAELAEKLPFRNYQEEDYARALEKLVKRGWAEKDKEGYALTEEGKSVREEVENKTDEIYKAAFSVLSEEELAELTAMLTSMADALTPETAEDAPPA